MATNTNIIDKVLRIDAELVNEIPLQAELSLENLYLEVEFDVGSGGRFPYYEGEYEITPKLVEQELPTTNKSMKENVKVLEIPREEVSNLYGTTFVIAREG